MAKSTDDAFEEDLRFIAKRIKATSQEISSKPELDEAMDILGPATDCDRHYVQDQIARIVIQFRDDATVDAIKMPPRRKRRNNLDQLARGAHILGQNWQELSVPDRLRLSIVGGRIFDKALHALDDAGVDLRDFLRCLQEAATAAAFEIPGESGGDAGPGGGNPWA